MRDYRGYSEANVESTRRLLELFSNPVTNSNLKRFVLIGSQAACGPSPDDGTPITESDPLCPVSLYGRSKLEAEEVALSFTDRVPVTIVRPPTVFGPRDTDVLGVFKCTRYPLAPCLAGPDRMISIIYVEDLVAGILTAALASKSRWRGLLFGQPEARGLERIRPTGCSDCRLSLDYAARASACNETRGSGRRFARQGAQDSSTFQVGEAGRDETDSLGLLSGKAYRHLRWRPGTPLSAAIEKTLEWYRAHGWV